MLRRLRRSVRQLVVLMARRPGLVCGAAVVLSVLLVLAVKFTCSRAKEAVVLAARPPVRFFSPEVPVVDLYLGQLDQVSRLRTVAEVSLVFFYAPWCAHSAAARQEVQEVARRLAGQVQFVAVNCWWNQGKCRKQKSFYHYPVIHLFYRRFGPIEYKGPFRADYVESFILKVITPLTYLPSRDTLRDFLSYHEPGVVGFFQFSSSPLPPGYLVYLSTALQALKRDFQGVVRFGVVTSLQVAEAISVSEDQTVYLHRHFNDSLIFPRWEQNFTSEVICSWIFQHRETVLQWLQPPAAKSRLLEHELTKGPALLLFLPHDPLGHVPDPLLTQVAGVAVRYQACKPHPPDQSHRGHAPCCHSLVLSRPGHAPSVCELCLNLSQRSELPGSSPCMLPSRTLIPPCCPVSVTMSARTVACSNVVSSYSGFGLYSACCRGLRPQLDPPAVTLQEGVPPPSSSDSSSSSPVNDRPSYSQERGGFTGLRCRTNKTLRFYVLDSALHWPLAVRLGALGDGLQGEAVSLSDRPFTTIVSLREEVHYVMDHRGTASYTQALEDFIRNFSIPFSPLQRHLVGDGEQGTRPLITELTTSTFLSSVMDPHKDVLLFYYTQWCGFCSALNHVIIQLARLFHDNNTVSIARVNVARNDLPWEFMVDHFPSVLLFPRHRKHLSVKFPDDTPITLPNLLRFLLKHAGPSPRARRPPGHAPLRTELRALQGEVQALHRARERLAIRLAALRRKNERHPAPGAEPRQEEGRSLEEQRRAAGRRLGEVLRRLQELTHSWHEQEEGLLRENTMLHILLGGERRGEEEERGQEERLS